MELIADTIRADVVIVGSGAAGMMAALDLSPLSVALITKKELGAASSSNLAQGGIAAAVSPDDDPELHARDTLRVGKGLSDPEVVRLATGRGPELIQRLIDLGTEFDRGPDGAIALGREAAHSERRVVHAHGDATGAEVVRALKIAVCNSPPIRVLENCFAVDLIVESGRVGGLIARTAENGWIYLQSGSVILATGGIGSLYSYSTNPVEATGDGLAMAARAGATLGDLEFVQFHPTALASEHRPLSLLTEAIRGEGAVLVDETGCRFMLDEHPDAELAPRDTVSRAIWRMRELGHQVFLDARDAVGERFPQRFPTAFRNCLELGIDPRTDRIPVCPAAHYHVGGIVTDLSGRTSIPGLWACGETACTALHGANRLASNSLLEAMVFGVEVAQQVKGDWKSRAVRLPSAPAMVRSWTPEPPAVRNRIQNLMWKQVGLVRDRDRLCDALDTLWEIQESTSPGPGELRNLLTVAQLVTRSALDRRESRGVHYREDYPETHEEFARHSYIRLPHPDRERVVAEAGHTPFFSI